MSEYRKTSPDDLYFVTLTVTGWIDLFSRKVYKDILVQNLHHCQQNEQLQIFSYVIMTNHPTPLYTWDVIKQKEKYIHENPVSAGLVTDASAYLFSSASPLKVFDM